MDMLAEIKAAEQQAEAKKADARTKAKALVQQVQIDAEAQSKALLEKAKAEAAALLDAAKEKAAEQTAQLNAETEAKKQTLSACAEQNQAAAVQRVMELL